jgi:hypothetical protein
MHRLALFSKTKWLLLLGCIATSSISVANNSIGDIFEQSGSVGKISRTTGETLQAELKAGIVSMDEVETANGRLKIKFIDDTQVSLTENTYMEINEYVYDPDPNKSRMALNFVSGTARFATGGLGLVPRENIQIQTPTASIGIRGTDFTTTVDELGRSLVILLPDANCTDKVALEEGCRPSGSITVSNLGGTQLLTEAYQAVMVSTFETIPTPPVKLVNLNLDMIDNMFIVSEPKEITVAQEEQQDQLKGDAGLLDFDGLDQEFLDQAILEEDTNQQFEFSELDIDYLNVEFLNDLLDMLSDDIDALAEEKLASGSGDKLISQQWGRDPSSQFNNFPEYDGKVFFLREVNNKIGIKLAQGSTAQIILNDKDTGETVFCLNQCESIYIRITQND